MDKNGGGLKALAVRAVPAICLWAIALAAILYKPAATLLHASLLGLTEGNSTAKAALFVAFLAIVFSARAVAPAWRQRGWAKKALVAAIALSMLWGILLNTVFMARYGADANGFVAHVSGCGDSWCWEGTYLQHNHIPKTAIYALEKSLGIGLVAGNADNGKPLYDITPWADLAAPFTLALLAVIVLLGIYVAASERNWLKAALLAASAALFAIATIDGGIFTSTGINAVAFLAAYLLIGTNAPLEQKIAAPFAVAAVIAYAPNFLLASELHFKEWVLPCLFASLIAGYDDCRRLRPRRLALVAVMLVVAMLYAINASAALFGKAAVAANATAAGMPGLPLLTVYGLPPALDANASADAAQVQFSSYVKYGWYFAGSPVAGTRVSATELSDELRGKFNAGYTYADYYGAGYYYRKIYVAWNSKQSADEDFAGLYSLSVAKKEDHGNYVAIEGVSSLPGPALALQVASYLKSRGADATVITTIT